MSSKKGKATDENGVHLQPLTSLLLQKTEALIRDAQDFNPGNKAKKKKRSLKSSLLLKKLPENNVFGEEMGSVSGGGGFLNSNMAQISEDLNGSSVTVPALPPLNKRGGTADGTIRGRNNLFNSSISSGEQSSFIDDVQLGNAERHLRSVKSAPSFLQESHAIRRPKPPAGGHPIEDKVLSDFPGIPVTKQLAKPGSRQVKSRDGGRNSNDWSNQRVSEIAGEVQPSNTSSGWENELARHILSMYASTTAAKDNDVKSSQAIIRYVDTTTVDGVGTEQVKQLIYGSSQKPSVTTLRTPGPSRGNMGSISRNSFNGSNGESENDASAAGGGDSVEEEAGDESRMLKSRDKARKRKGSTKKTLSSPAVQYRSPNRGMSAVVKDGVS